MQPALLVQSPPNWKDGEEQPPPMVHALGPPECVEALKQIVERASLATLRLDHERQLDANRGLLQGTIELRERLAVAMEALHLLDCAVVDEGPFPSFHQKIMRSTREAWPTLMEAVDNARQALARITCEEGS